MAVAIQSLAGVRAVVLKELPGVLLSLPEMLLSRPEAMLTTLNHLVIPRDPLTAVVVNRPRLKPTVEATVMHSPRVNRLRTEVVPLMNRPTLVKRAALIE